MSDRDLPLMRDSEESGDLVIPVAAAWSKSAHVSADSYKATYENSLAENDAFWAAEAKAAVTWRKPWHTVRSGSFSEGNVRWFDGGRLNVSENCIDRHLASRASKTAIVWIGNEPHEQRTLTYKDLYDEVNRFAHGLSSLGVGKGDRVVLYMPMVPEAAIAMLAIARLGAVHSVVFGGFSAKSLRERIEDSGAKVVLTADEAPRGPSRVPLKAIVDEALDAGQGRHFVERVVVLRRTQADVPLVSGRDIYWHDLAHDRHAGPCHPEEMDAEDPLFILYTSGSTGRPKGLLHTSGGYLVYAATTFKNVFNIHEDDVFWCTADVGWITGHSYVVYGPLAHGATVVMYEGTPVHPDPSRLWREIAKHKVTVFYTAPTAIRALMKLGDQWLKGHGMESLRVLGTVGEPINPKAWLWYFDVVGKKKLPIVDTWWQTETGGMMISPLPGATPLKPGSATKPLFGIEPALLLPDSGQELSGPSEGALVIKRPWPGMARTVWGDHERYMNTYFRAYPGVYFTGDGASRDGDGYYRISGRMDDVINVSGHRLGTFEVESALVGHPSVAEAAVIGVSHDIKGQAIYAFVTLKDGQDYTDHLKHELILHVRKDIGPIATPERIHWAPGLPKTRSGKIMRRILRKIAEGDLDNLGDTSTLADPKVVDQLLEDRAKPRTQV